jgi:hypothetical protein
MPSTKQNGKQQKNSAGTGFGNSKSSPKSSSKFDALLREYKGKKISNTELRLEVFMILDDAGVGRGSEVKEDNYYFFEYDPKYRSMLKEWDRYPLIRVIEKKGNILGANLHYVSPKERLSILNNKKRAVPKETLHYYIPRNRETNFYELTEADAIVLSQLPLDKFYRNR